MGDVEQSGSSRTRKKRQNKTPIRRKGSGNGKTRRTPKQLARQEEVFRLSVLEGKTQRVIAATLNITQDTVVSDLRAEEARRAEELGARREGEKARAVAMYEDIYRRAIVKSDRFDEIIGVAMEKADEDARDAEDREIDLGDGIKIGRKPNYQDTIKVTDHSLDAALKARERIDKVLGVDAPVKADIGLDAFLDALNKPLDDDDDSRKEDTGGRKPS